MLKLCIFAGTFILSYAGWYLGELLHFEFFGCFLISGFASVAGVIVGWKIGRRFS